MSQSSMISDIRKQLLNLLCNFLSKAPRLTRERTGVRYLSSVWGNANFFPFLSFLTCMHPIGRGSFINLDEELQNLHSALCTADSDILSRIGSRQSLLPHFGWACDDLPIRHLHVEYSLRPMLHQWGRGGRRVREY